MKFLLFGGAQDVCSTLTTVCCMLLPHNPYRLHQRYTRQAYGPSRSCKHRYLWVSLTFELYFCLNYVGRVRHWQPFWWRKRFRFIGQCWYINPQWTAMQAISKHAVLVSWGKMLSYQGSTHICRCLWRGLGGGGGTFWILNESLTFMGTAAQQDTTVNRIGVNKIPPNFDTLFATSL